MTAREYPVFTVTPKAERSLRAGHPWGGSDRRGGRLPKW